MPAATVTFELAAPGQSRSRSPFDDFFGGSVFSGTFGRQPAMQTLAIPSNRPRLEVLDLPVAGRPAGFNGWIGQFEIEARALPDREVAVGEPITLSLEVRGVGHPPGSRLSVARPAGGSDPGFQVPREMGAGEQRDNAWHFTQTLRASMLASPMVPAI